MKGIIGILLLLGGLLGLLFYLGGTVLAIGLGVISLTLIIFAAFTLGSRWTYTVMKAGADLAIRSAGQNDAHDALKIKALAQLTQEGIAARKRVVAGPAYPMLPGLQAVEGSFTISGLDDGEMGQEQRQSYDVDS